MPIGDAFNRRGHGGGKVGNRIEPGYDWQWGFLGGSVVKNLPAMQELQEVLVRSLGWEDPLEKEMATHSSILAWEILWTEEPGGL